MAGYKDGVYFLRAKFADRGHRLSEAEEHGMVDEPRGSGRPRGSTDRRIALSPIQALVSVSPANAQGCTWLRVA